MRLKNMTLSLVVILGLLLGNFAFYGNASPAAAHIPDTRPAAQQVQNQLRAATFPVIADFEGGVPAGWFQYGDGGTTVNVSVPTIPDNDPLALPGQVGDNDVLSVVANVPTWAGFGAGLSPVQNWSDYDALSFWFYGSNSGDIHEVEIQTATAGNRRAIFADDFTGWRQIILPFHTFGAGGAYDVSQVTNWVFVLDGANSSFSLDNLQLVNLQPFADFEGGVPTGWFQYGDGGTTVNISVPTVPAGDPLALPGQVGDNDILAVTANVPSWAGYGAGFTPAQNWSDMQGVSFWFYGENSGEVHEFEIQTANAGNRRATFVDNFTGWRLIVLPFTTFGNTPYDVSQVTNWVMVLDGMNGAFYQDHLSVYGDAGGGTPPPPPANPWPTITFDSPEVTYTLTGFGGADDSTVVVDPTDPTNNVARVVKSATAELWAGTTVSTGPNNTVPQLLFTADDTTMTVRVWSPDAGIQIRLKVEDATDGSKSVETEATTTVANDWETLTFDFANEAAGTAPLNLAYTYNRVSIFFNFGVPGSVAGEKTYYFDDMAFSGGTPPPPPPAGWPTITFDSPEVTYTLTGFGGADDSTVVVDPTDPTNNVARVVKSATAELWAGTTVSTGPNNTVPQLLFTADDTTMTVRVWSPDAGIQIRLKVEDATDGSKSVETEATTTVANDWETLTFDFANEAAGTAPLNLAYTYNRVSIFFNFGVPGSVAGEKTYYFDDMAFSGGTPPPPPPGSGISVIIDDFESGLPSGVDAYGNGIGFITWGDFWTGTTVEIATTLVGDSDPLARPGQSGDTHLLKFDANVNGWGGLTHAFENEDVDTWVPQDWSSYEGIAFWLYGQNTGNDLLFEVQDNRNPGSTGTDTEIWSHGFKDDFSGWRMFVLDFDDDFFRKEIGNGAPNDGFGRDEVHGWAFGTLNTGGATVTYYLDNVALIVRTTIIDDFESGLPSGEDAHGNGIGFVTWGDFWTGTTVAITTTLVGEGDPLALPGQSGDNNLLQFTAAVNGWGGLTHAFENEDVDTWVPQDWSSYEGIAFWLYGQNTGNDLLFEVQDNRNPGSTGTDTEIWSHGFKDDFSGWRMFVLDFDDDFFRKEIGNGAPNDGFGRDEVHGWAFGTLNTGGATVTYYLDNVMIYGNTGADRPLTVAFARGQASVTEGQTAVLTVALTREHDEDVTVEYATAEANARPWQYTPVSGMLTFPAGTLTQTISIPTYHDGKHTRDVRVAVNLYEGDGAPLGFQRRAILTIVDIDPANPALMDDFEGYHPFIYQEGGVDLSITTLMAGDPLAVPGQLDYEDVLTVVVDGAASFSRVFAQGQDWSAFDGLRFWFYGQNSGETITFQLRENMAATTAEVDPEDWVLVWSDEFDGPVGTPPNPNVWKYELGDGALNGIVGWGNSEFQYYTDSTENSFMDGDGNLVIRLQDADPADDLVCWYGPCEYTSARLLTQDRLDFEYGRIEARVLVPDGPGGLWPAFWMLGSNIPEVGWPQSGEIDIMEYVSRLPNEIFGTIHGPGYEGGASFGNIYNFGYPVANDYHTYAVEWMPDHIIWYVDDIQYHQAVPADVAPREWVFNHPFFMLLNAAIGGNFGGAIAGNMTMPQDTLVDYVRVYQAADTAERFEATFVDNFTGWSEVFLPFDAFTRSAEQPAGAPDDGLTLTEVWGYGFSFSGNRSNGTFHLDQVSLVAPATALTVDGFAARSTLLPVGLLVFGVVGLLLTRKRQ